MLMRLDLELTTEAVVATVVEVVATVVEVVATVVEVVDPGKEDSEGIRLLCTGTRPF